MNQNPALLNRAGFFIISGYKVAGGQCLRKSKPGISVRSVLRDLIGSMEKLEKSVEDFEGVSSAGCRNRPEILAEQEAEEQKKIARLTVFKSIYFLQDK
jgi:hypothetical protein